MSHGTFGELTGVRAETHGPAVVTLHELLLLLRHDIDDRVRSAFVYFGGGGSFEPRFIPRVFDDQELHAVTEAEVRDLPLAGVGNGRDDAFNSTLSESAGH